MPLYNPVQLVQTAFAEITADTSTTSTAFADLLTITLSTVTGSMLNIHFTVSALLDTNNLQAYFRVLVDGSSLNRGLSISAAATNSRQSGALTCQATGLAAGSHTVKVQWRLASSHTINIDVVTNPDFSHAALLVEEVSV